MSDLDPTNSLISAAAAVVFMAGCLGAFVTVNDLPSLSFFLGPDLTVRTVTEKVWQPSAQNPGSNNQLKVGDQVFAIEGVSIYSLSDLRHVLESVDKNRLEYHLFRPVHYQNIRLSETDNPTSWLENSGSELELVAVDGRQFSKPMGKQGLQSVISNRSSGVLTVRQKDVLLTSTFALSDSESANAVIVVAIMMLLFLFLLAWYHSGTLSPGRWAGLQLEVLALGWMAVVSFEFQWILSVDLLAVSGMLALVLMRPAALYTKRMQLEDAAETEGVFALALGILAAAVLTTFWGLGYLPNTETLLHVGAIIGALFLAYEIFLVGFEYINRLERHSLYLTSLVILGLFATFIGWYWDPGGFQNGSWRWFVLSLAGITFINDIFYALFSTESHSFEVIRASSTRKTQIAQYLAALDAETAGLSPALAVNSRTAIVRFALDENGQVETELGSQTLVDTIQLLWQERARIPSYGGQNGDDGSLSELGKQVGLSLAAPLTKPLGAVETNHTRVFVLGTTAQKDEQTPVHIDPEIFELCQNLMHQTTWSAAVVEALSYLETVDLPNEASTEAKAGDDAPEPSEPAPPDEQTAGVEPESNSADDSQTLRLLKNSAMDLGSPPPDQFRQLLEDELLDAIDYLLDSPEPIVLAGQRGAGKEFVARCAHAMSPQHEHPFVIADVLALQDKADDAPGSSPETTSGNASLREQVLAPLRTGETGSYLVQAAGHLSDAHLLQVCQKAEQLGVRVYFGFDHPSAENETVLADRTEEILSLLEHRELIIPNLAHRTTILENICNYYLQRIATQYGRDLTGFSEAALETLQDYAYPGGIEELIGIVSGAVKNADGKTVEADHLPRLPEVRN